MVIVRGSKLWLDFKHEGNRLRTPVAKAAAAKLQADADWLRRLGIADAEQTTDSAVVADRIEPAIRLDWIAHLNGLGVRPAVVSRSAAGRLVRDWFVWRAARPRFKSRSHIEGRVERLTRWLDARQAEAADLLDGGLTSPMTSSAGASRRASSPGGG